MLGEYWQVQHWLRFDMDCIAYIVSNAWEHMQLVSCRCIIMFNRWYVRTFLINSYFSYVWEQMLIKMFFFFLHGKAPSNVYTNQALNKPIRMTVWYIYVFNRRANCPFSCVSTGTSSVHGVSISGKGQAGWQTLLYFTGSGIGCFVAIHKKH